MEVQEEKEFDPTIHTAEYVAVEHDESFAQIRDKIEDALRRTPNVILIIPRGSQAFHTTQDFLALGKLQWRREVRVAVATPDPTIAGLARVLGFHIVDPPADHPALVGDPGLEDSAAQDDHNGTIEKPTSPLPLGSVPDWVLSPNLPSPTYTPRVSTSGSLTTSTWLSMPGEGDAQAVLDPSRPPTRAGQPPPRRRQRQTGHLLPTQLPEISSDPALDSDVLAAQPQEQDGERARLAVLESKAYSSGRGWRYGGSLRRGGLARVLVSLAIVLALLLGAASGYAYVYLPEGKVLVTPKSKNITGLPVQISVTTGTPNPLKSVPEPQANQVTPVATAQSITATLIEEPLVEEGTAPATGTRQIPRGVAQGTLHFVNGAEQSKFIAEGTQITGKNGVVYKITQGGTLGPSNFLGGNLATLDLSVTATVEGPDGNLPLGQLVGSLGAAQFTNITPIQGGTLETVKVILKEDIDNLAAQLSTRLHERYEGVILGKVGSETLIRETIDLKNEQRADSAVAGTDGDSVSVKITGVAVAYTYDEISMEGNVRQAVYDSIQNNEPRTYGSVIDPNSIVLTDPILQPSTGSEQGVIFYTLTASARVNYSLTDTLAEQIRDRVAGQNIKDVRSIIANQYGTYVSADTVEAKVLWFNLDKLPTDATRIEVQQLGTSGNTATIPQTQPQSQPNAETRGDNR